MSGPPPLARARLLERLRAAAEVDAPEEYRFSMPDAWSRRVFVALLRRYGLKPYRYRRQRSTTIMVRVSPRFVDETLWPEFQEIHDTLRTYLDEVTTRVVREVLHDDLSDVAVTRERGALGPADAGSPGPAGAGTRTRGE